MAKSLPFKESFRYRIFSEPRGRGRSRSWSERYEATIAARWATNQHSLTRGLRTLEGKVWCSLSHLIATAVSYHADGPLVTFCEKGFAWYPYGYKEYCNSKTGTKHFFSECVIYRESALRIRIWRCLSVKKGERIVLVYKNDGRDKGRLIMYNTLLHLGSRLARWWLIMDRAMTNLIKTSPNAPFDWPSWNSSVLASLIARIQHHVWSKCEEKAITWRFMYPSVLTRNPRYSNPHFNRTNTGFPVSSWRNGFGLTGLTWFKSQSRLVLACDGFYSLQPYLLSDGVDQRQRRTLKTRPMRQFKIIIFWIPRDFFILLFVWFYLAKPSWHCRDDVRPGRPLGRASNRWWSLFTKSDSGENDWRYVHISNLLPPSC